MMVDFYGQYIATKKDKPIPGVSKKNCENTRAEKRLAGRLCQVFTEPTREIAPSTLTPRGKLEGHTLKRRIEA